MKKFFAIMLSLMLLLTALVPMSVSAVSVAEEETFDPSTTFEYRVAFRRTSASDILEDAYVYTWTPEYEGALTLYGDDDGGNVRVLVRKAGTTKNLAVFDYNGEYKEEYEVTCTVAAGTEYNIYIMTSTGKSGNASFFAGYYPQNADGIMGAGVESLPYILESTATPLPKIEAGKRVYFAIQDMDDTLKYDLTVKGATGDKFTVYAGLNDLSETSSKGSATVEAVAPTVNDVLIFSVENTGTTTGGPYTFSYVESEATISGDMDNPDTLKVNTTLTAKITGFAYYYTYTPTEDGTLVFTMPEDKDWIICLMGNEWVLCDSTNEETENPVCYDVTDGEELTIWVANAGYTAGKLTFDVTFLKPGETLPTEAPTTEATEPPTSEPKVTDSTEPPTSEPKVTDPTEPPTSEPKVTDSTEPPTSEPKDTDPTKTPSSEPKDTDPTASGSTPDEGDGMLGDVNGDGVVNVKDATAIQKHIAGLIELSDKALILADYNLDKAVNIKDATTIQKKIAGLI